MGFLLLTTITEVHGILRLLLDLLSPPSPPRRSLGGWRPLPGPVFRPSSSFPRPRPPNRHQQFPIQPTFQSNNPFPTRFFPDLRFKPHLQTLSSQPSSTPSPLLTDEFVNRFRPFEVHSDDNSLHLSQPFGNGSTELKVFDTVDPSIIENTLFRYDRKKPAKE